MNDMYLLSLRNQRAGHQGQARLSMERGGSSSSLGPGATHCTAPHPLLQQTQARLGEGYWEERERQLRISPVWSLSSSFILLLPLSHS